jgi:hypothetical protein
MEPATTIIDPERALTLVYAPARVRPALAALWRLDERLGSVVATTTEPMIGAIRLAWWREALEALDRGGPPDEPLLCEIGETLLPLGIKRGRTGGDRGRLGGSARRGSAGWRSDRTTWTVARPPAVQPCREDAWA